MSAKMTGKEAVKLSGRSESWLRRHECAWCNQRLWNALLYGCGAIHEQCDPKKKNFGKDAMARRTCASVANALEGSSPHSTAHREGE